MRTNKNIRRSVRAVALESNSLYKDKMISKSKRDARLEALEDVLHMLDLAK